MGLKVLSDLVLDPLKSDSLLVYGLEEHIIRAVHLEEQLHVVAGDGSLELLFRRLAVRVGQACHVYHI